MATRANYGVVIETKQFILIDDRGPWSRYATVTNEAGAVVAEMAPKLRGRRLYYIDSEGWMDEILVSDNKFAGFRVLETGERRVPRGKKTAHDIPTPL